MLLRETVKMRLRHMVMNKQLQVSTISNNNSMRGFVTVSWQNPYPINSAEALHNADAARKAITSEYLVKTLTSRVYDAAIETPTAYAAGLSKLLTNEVYLKREDTQPVFSFKIRGAFNKIAHLSAEQLQRGVVTCSAGNHAQGVAMSATKLGVKATIVMPEMTPRIKVSAVERFGGEYTTVLLHGNNYDEAAAEAQRLVKQQGLTMVHPFDDPLVIAGQGTIGMEILKTMQSKPVDIVFVCVGGGGMLAGVAAYIKAIKPEVKVVGVEAAEAAGMTQSLLAGKVVTLEQVGQFADGAAVRTIGATTFRICDALADELITVKTDEICAAIKLCFNDTRCVLEPAGALGIAGMVKYLTDRGITGQRCVAITSGANMDFDRLRFVSERADRSETLFSITIPERPGAFRQFYRAVYPRNVTEFSYRYNGTERASIVVSLQTPLGVAVEADKQQLLAVFSSNGYDVVDYTDNELAKQHVRHLAGGRPVSQQKYPSNSSNNNNSNNNSASNESNIDDSSSSSNTNGISSNNSSNSSSKEDKLIEVLYRFEFPESPGALGKFLFTLTDFNADWNISLFHYRNHGHDFGRVLVGLHLRQSETAALDKFLDEIAYPHCNETGNSAYLQFLK